tara:strand:+ start:282 stop:611 length:330 start_codon:yes stop_codon:yes gene_type:complete
MIIEIKDIPKLSFNKYNHLHWAKKKAFKDTLRLLVCSSTTKSFKGGYSLDFTFEFIGRKLDTINVFHYCKIIEDKLFEQDKDNRKICVNVVKGTENKCTLELIENPCSR